MHACGMRVTLVVGVIFAKFVSFLKKPPPRTEQKDKAVVKNKINQYVSFSRNVSLELGTRKHFHKSIKK